MYTGKLKVHTINLIVVVKRHKLIICRDSIASQQEEA